LAHFEAMDDELKKGLEKIKDEDFKMGHAMLKRKH
jgi:hypothetical protein